MRYRIVRAAELTGLRADLATARTDLENAHADARAEGIRGTARAQDLLRQLGQALADQAAAERETAEQFAGLQAVIRRVTDERDAARAAVREEYGSVADQMGADLAQLRADAADPETGQSMRAAIAYGVLGRMIADVRAQGLPLDRPFDIIAVVLGFTDDDQEEAAAQPHPL